MQKFLLLRNNKQTGPYSVEELEQLGLKPYDLIWVNGKSAAWRYPGEIDELKPFAPAVEEQPYDRFYKKPTEEKSKKNEPAKVEPVSVNSNGSGNGNGNANGNGNGAANNNIGYTPTVNPSPSKKEKEYKRVFVTLPNSSPVKKASTTEQAQIQEPQPQTQQIIPEPIPSISEKQKPQKIEAHLDERNGHSSYDIYYSRNQSFYSRKSFLITALAIGIISLIGLGMFIGLSLQKPNRDAGKQETEKVYRVPEKETKPPVPDSNLGLNNGVTNNPAPALVSKIDSASLLANAKRSKISHSSTLKSQLKDLDQKAVKPIDSGLLNTQPVKVEPEKKLPEKKAPNLAKLVSVSNSDFQVGPFGGISRLELTVHNSSEVDLDLVVVELEYLKVNKEIFKTETLYFKDVGANSSITIAAPKSSRGNKINYKISLISAKDRLFHASSD